MEGPVYYETPHRFSDERGFFQEIYNGSRMGESLDDHGSLPSAMVQVNHSRSKKGVLRGMHWQQPNPVGKYVTCIHGHILDVVVDIRRSSPTFKQWQGYEIDAEKGQALWVPEGFAHGFLVTSLVADVIYAQSKAFNQEGDRTLRWDDADVAIAWPEMRKGYTISEKDRNAPLLSELSEEALFD
jgi:dTDP-4-dehydrorhamnose 3,5-epimerase